MNSVNLSKRMSGAAGIVLAAAAFAQPSATDLGTLAMPSVTPITASMGSGEIIWYQMTLPSVSRNLAEYLDIAGGSGSLTGGDSEIGLYDAAGNLIASDDDDGAGLWSSLSFGLDVPTRVNTGGVAHNGRDGANLSGGLYYLAVTGFNATFGATGWGVTTTHTRSGDVNLTLTLGVDTTPVNPTATGPNITANAGGTALMTVTVVPGRNPPSSGLQVSLDLSGVGGSGTQTAYDDGTNGDATAGDNIFSYSYTVPGATGTGNYPIAFSVVDAQSRTANGTFNLQVFGSDILAEVGDAGDLPDSAQTNQGSGTLGGISGTNEVSDVDMYAINICDSSTFSATTVGGATFDTQLFLFNADGTGVSVSDDSAGGTQSTLTNTYVSANGNYLLAISRYNRDPVDSAGALIWINTPFGTERAPDGPGASNPISSWLGTTTGTGTYLITMTGVCRGGGGPVCIADVDDGSNTGTRDGAVTLEDLLYYLNLYDQGVIGADVDNGTFTGTRDGGVTIDDLLYYLSRYDAGC